MNVQIAYRAINSLYIKQTDCWRTYKHMMSKINRCREFIQDFTSLEIFEVIIRLSKKGLQDFKAYIYPYWPKRDTNIWVIRSLEKQIKYLENHEKTRG